MLSTKPSLFGKSSNRTHFASRGLGWTPTDIRHLPATWTTSLEPFMTPFSQVLDLISESLFTLYAFHTIVHHFLAHSPTRACTPRHLDPHIHQSRERPRRASAHHTTAGNRRPRSTPATPLGRHVGHKPLAAIAACHRRPRSLWVCRALVPPHRNTSVSEYTATHSPRAAFEPALHTSRRVEQEEQEVVVTQRTAANQATAARGPACGCKR